MGYPYKTIEQKWQAYWEEEQIFRTPDTIDTSRPKYYILDMFPYPSGAGLHVGHPEGYTATDIIARYKRMNGFNVLHPMGWDAFGLPAEQYAIETGTHPAVTTQKNVDRFRDQLKSLGFSYDWQREVNTTDPGYYRWTQWIFLQLYKKGLAYLEEVPVNWCPALGTVLANEEVIDGKSERGGHPVYRRPMRQWMLKITAYADRLLEDLDELDWPTSTIEMQRNWIGRSEGAEVDFAVANHPDAMIRVFTTRPDTLFGATYMILAPEHELVDKITADAQRNAVAEYVRQAQRKSDLERTELQKDKTGVATGAYAINPVNDEKIPIWVADYVLASYGTGAIMAVPAHDERDYEFARTFELPIREVISGGDIEDAAFVSKGGTLVNSSSAHLSLDGLSVSDAISKIIDWLESEKKGTAKVNYKLRDWLFSRQRYWGEPFPILHAPDGKTVPLDESELPLVPPEMEDYKPQPAGEDSVEPVPPLGRAGDEWKYVERDGVRYTREFNTMPQWAGSCWYYLRFIDPDNPDVLIDPEKEKYWMDVDLYVGGAEHSVLHLLYARFWHKFLYDLGVVSGKEPFRKLVHQGMILGETEYTVYFEDSGAPVSAEFVNSDETHKTSGEKLEARRIPDEAVTKKGDYFVWTENTGIRVRAQAPKMSKSRGNVINPDDIVEKYGADSLRLYEMFMGPLEQMKPWSMRGVDGISRFLNRVWRLMIDEETDTLLPQINDSEPDRDQLRALHGVIKKVTEDIENMRFNTGISAMMVFVNEANRWSSRPKSVLEQFLLVLSPYAPHLAEELWQRLGNADSLTKESWPQWDEQWLVEDTKTIVVQINGKVRENMEVPSGMADDRGALEQTALALDGVQKRLDGVTIVKMITVPGRLVNIVVK